MSMLQRFRARLKEERKRKQSEREHRERLDALRSTNIERRHEAVVHIFLDDNQVEQDMLAQLLCDRDLFVAAHALAVRERRSFSDSSWLLPIRDRALEIITTVFEEDLTILRKTMREYPTKRPRDYPMYGYPSLLSRLRSISGKLHSPVVIPAISQYLNAGIDEGCCIQALAEIGTSEAVTCIESFLLAKRVWEDDLGRRDDYKDNYAVQEAVAFLLKSGRYDAVLNAASKPSEMCFDVERTELFKLIPPVADRRLFSLVLTYMSRKTALARTRRSEGETVGHENDIGPALILLETLLRQRIVKLTDEEKRAILSWPSSMWVIEERKPDPDFLFDENVHIKKLDLECIRHWAEASH